MIPRIKPVALAVLFLSIAALALAYAAAVVTGATAAWSPWVMAFATAIAMVSTMAVGAARAGKPNGGLGRLAVPFVLILVLILVGFTLALLLPSAGEPLVLGLPRRAAIILYGIGLLPVFILPVAYAWTFDEMTLSERDLERVREMAKSLTETAQATDETT